MSVMSPVSRSDSARAAVSFSPLSMRDHVCSRTSTYSDDPSTTSTPASTATYQMVSRTRARVNSGFSVRAAERIPEPANGADGILLQAGGLQLAAHVVHVDVDDVRRRLEPGAPDLLAQLVARQHLSGVAHQVLEQRKLRAGQLDRRLAD